jgi:aminoglycoside phosphotransferase (APT) family kinase protein
LLAASLAEAAAAIHQVDISHAPPALALPTSWDDYVDGQIELLLRIERDHSEPLPVLRYLGRWLAKNKPPPISLGLVHGDFEAPNLLVAEDNSFRIVDWETAKVGDPREDLGWFHMMGSSMVPPDLIGRDTDSFCSRYRELTGVGEEVLNPAVLSYFGVFGAISNLNVCLSFLGDLERGETRGLFATYMPRVLLTFSLAMFNLAAAKTRSTTQ